MRDSWATTHYEAHTVDVRRKYAKVKSGFFDIEIAICGFTSMRLYIRYFTTMLNRSFSEVSIINTTGDSLCF